MTVCSYGVMALERNRQKWVAFISFHLRLLNVYQGTRIPLEILFVSLICDTVCYYN